MSSSVRSSAPSTRITTIATRISILSSWARKDRKKRGLSPFLLDLAVAVRLQDPAQVGARLVRDVVDQQPVLDFDEEERREVIRVLQMPDEQPVAVDRDFTDDPVFRVEVAAIGVPEIRIAPALEAFTQPREARLGSVR